MDAFTLVQNAREGDIPEMCAATTRTVSRNLPAECLNERPLGGGVNRARLRAEPRQAVRSAGAHTGL